MTKKSSKKKKNTYNLGVKIIAIILLLLTVMLYVIELFV